MEELFYDGYFDDLIVFDTVDNLVTVSGKAARFDVVNRNKRLLRKGALQSRQVVPVSPPWGHRAGQDRTVEPIGEAEIWPEGEDINYNIAFDTTDEYVKRAVEKLKSKARILGVSLGYRSPDAFVQRMRSKVSGAIVQVFSAPHTEFFDLAFDTKAHVAVPSSTVAFDTLEEVPSEPELEKAEPEAVDLTSVESGVILAELNRRGEERYADVRPYIERIAEYRKGGF